MSFTGTRPVPDASDSIATTSAIAALAYILADVIHEAIGHGGACVLLGGKIALLTSAYFRCLPPGMRIVDASGPIANLSAAVLFWLALQVQHGDRPKIRLFLLLGATFNALWGAGQMVYSALLNTDDWAFALRGLLPSWLWRSGLILLGGALYYAVLIWLDRAMAPFAVTAGTATPQRARRLLVVSYLASGVVACLAALFYVSDPLGAMREGALETLAANSGLLFLSRRLRDIRDAVVPVATIALDLRWTIGVGVAFLIFAATIGRGL